MDTITLTHQGRPVALAAPNRFWLAAHIEALADGHPRKRHVCLMALYARDVLTGLLPGPYRDADAERFATAALNACATDATGRTRRAPRLRDRAGCRAPMRGARISRRGHAPS